MIYKKYASDSLYILRCYRFQQSLIWKNTNVKSYRYGQTNSQITNDNGFFFSK